jgi:hypothetical protein
MEQEHRTVDDELGDNDWKRGKVLEGEYQGNGTRPTTTSNPRSAQPLHPGLRG